MKCITKIKLKNFKRFDTFSCPFDPDLNLLIGDNEAGKSSILTAIDIVFSGSRSKVDTLGLDCLFNQEVIDEFLASDKAYVKLPEMFVELYLNEQGNMDLEGEVNSEERNYIGLRMLCEPDHEYSKEIREILKQPEANFPYEFYAVTFKTFSGLPYSGYRKYIKHLLIDNSQISNEYATKEFVKSMYGSNANNAEKSKHHNEYRKHKDAFKESILHDLNDKLTDYAFAIRNNSKANLETDLTLKEDNIYIENKGKGRQCFIKTDFAINKKNSKLDIVLIEEPENHLSHQHMKRLIQKIRDTEQKQVFITTHNTMVSTRLDLRKAILLNHNSRNVALLDKLSLPTATFFMKAPDNNIMEFILSKKVVLVEGDAEFMLMEAFYKRVCNSVPEADFVHVISIGGTSFKRYLELAKLLSIKTAVIRDNDHDYQLYCVDRYKKFTSEIIHVFGDTDNARHTFEVCLYEDNKDTCEELFAAERTTLSVQDYMTKNKTDAAFELLDKKSSNIKVPNYIKQAIEWIRK
ncbi:MAG TPA: AAA family ATPase [Pelobium sp.]|nr:AAA family ATPase [Pelobium sp.]